MSRIAEPRWIQDEMLLYKLGVAILPQSYIDFHRDFAMASLEQMKATHEVHKVWMQADGWLIDRMQEVNAIVEKKGSNIIHKIHWQTFNQGWMVYVPCGGSVIYRPED